MSRRNWLIRRRKPARFDGAGYIFVVFTDGICSLSDGLKSSVVRFETTSLQRTADRGKRVIRVRADQTYRSDYEHQDHCEHHRVFGDVLTPFICPNWGEVKHSFTSFRS